MSVSVRILPVVVGLVVLACRANEPATSVAQAKPAAQPQADPDLTQVAAPVDTCAQPTGTWYLHLSDIHLGTGMATQAPGKDTSVALWDATKAELGSRLAGPNPPAFIVYTGDLPDHDPDRGSDHRHNIVTALNDLEALAGTIPLLYMPGNNDSLNWDYGRFTDAAGDTPLSDAGWAGPTLNTTASASDAAEGYYSAVPVPGLRVIALNTVIFSKNYPCSYQRDSPGACPDQQDAAAKAQLAWLTGELGKAGAASEKVLLAMHIPPGVDAYSAPALMWEQASWQDTFLSAIADSPAQVVGVAFGHTHLDELRRLYAGGGELLTLGLSAPGITPGHGNNPGFKGVAYEPGSFALTDTITWYATAPDPTEPVYTYADTNCYRYREVFGCASDQDLLTCVGGAERSVLDTNMDMTYLVQNGAPSFDTAPGIDVVPAG